jgi:FkbM family methyltransferase
MTKRGKSLFSAKEIAFMTVPLLFVASLWIYPEPMYLAVHAAGRAGICPLRQSLAARQVVDDQNEIAAKILAGSNVDAKDENAGLVRWRTPYGVFWAPPGTSVPFLLAEQATRVYGDGERRVRRGDITLDCGANVGTFTREALNAGARLVVAIEPAEENVEALRRNFAAEIEQGRVVVYPKEVWHSEEVLKFYSYDNSALDSFVLDNRLETNTKPREVRMPVNSVDRIVKELNLERVDFIKMDVEGAERHAIAGAKQTLGKFHPRMSIATENLGDDQYVVPRSVRQAWPGYKQECGRCMMTEDRRIRPDVVYFY